MSAVPSRDCEDELNPFGWLGIASEPEFDNLKEAAGALLDVPMAFLSVFEEDRENSAPIDDFFDHVLSETEPLVVADTHLDLRFAKNPLVTGRPRLRFFAGAPIVIEKGAVGTLCAVDIVPRQLTDRQIDGLSALAHQAAEFIKARRDAEAARRAETASREAKMRFAAIFDAVQVGVLMVGQDGRSIQTNRAASSILAGDLKSFLREDGANAYEILDTNGDPLAQADQPVFRALRGETVWDADVRLRWPDGHERKVRSNARPLYKGSDNEPYAAVCNILDVTLEAGYRSQFETLLMEAAQTNVVLNAQRNELVKANEKLACLATTDGLTGLRNHRAFQERLEEELLRSSRTGAPLSIALLDVDRFKAFNDEFGHQAGDAVLRGVATALEATVRQYDMAARYGGEEFVVVMPSTNADSALVVSERLRLAIETRNWPQRPVTASFGVATLTPGMTREALIEAADRALYESKNNGRNRITLAAPTTP